MLLLTTVLPSVVFRGSCDQEGTDFQFWITSLGLRGTEKVVGCFSLISVVKNVFEVWLNTDLNAIGK